MFPDRSVTYVPGLYLAAHIRELPERHDVAELGAIT